MNPKHSGKRKIKALEIIRDIRSGLEHSAVMTKYDLSAVETRKSCPADYNRRGEHRVLHGA